MRNRRATSSRPTSRAEAPKRPAPAPPHPQARALPTPHPPSPRTARETCWMSSESYGNVHVPAEKNSPWNAEKNVSKSDVAATAHSTDERHAADRRPQTAHRRCGRSACGRPRRRVRPRAPARARPSAISRRSENTPHVDAGGRPRPRRIRVARRRSRQRWPVVGRPRTGGPARRSRACGPETARPPAARDVRDAARRVNAGIVSGTTDGAQQEDREAKADEPRRDAPHVSRPAEWSRRARPASSSSRSRDARADASATRSPPSSTASASAASAASSSSSALVPSSGQRCDARPRPSRPRRRRWSRR